MSGIYRGTRYDSNVKKAIEYVIYYDEKIKSNFPTVIDYIGELLCGESEEFRKIYTNLMTAGSR